MKIDILTMDGSPLLVTMKSLYGEDGTVGVGGAEYGLLTMCEEWQKAGHQVTLYNNPREFGVSPFEQRNIADYNPNDKRDVLINFRSPNPKAIATINCLRVWWSTDQQTIGDYQAFSSAVDKIVCISPRHKQFFEQTYGIRNSLVIDLPVRVQDFDLSQTKIKNRLIFTSVPARGLDNLWRIYPKIQQEIPDVTLAITSDYRLWGVGASNEQFRVKWMKRTNVEYFGALKRSQYIQQLLKAQVLFYPSNYDELFCIAVGEAQYAGAYPITSATGSLPTTNMGTVIGLDANDTHNDSAFAENVVNMLRDQQTLESVQKEVHDRAKERFSPEVILKKWDDEVFN